MAGQISEAKDIREKNKKSRRGHTVGTDHSAAAAFYNLGDSVSQKILRQSVHEGRKCGKIWAESGEAVWIWRTEKAVRMRYNHVCENTAEQG